MHSVDLILPKFRQFLTEAMEGFLQQRLAQFQRSKLPARYPERPDRGQLLQTLVEQRQQQQSNR